MNIKADPIEAVSLRKQALELSYGPAARSFGLEYLSGSVVPKDERLAYQYFKEGASLGDAESMFQLALFISKSEEDDCQVRAKELFERAAEAGNASALRELANLYLSGSGGIPEDMKKAHEFQQRADVLERAYSYDIDPPILK
jgi:TPR repeat protein